MKYAYPILFFFLSLNTYVSKAQTCGTDEVHKQLMATNPTYAAFQKQNNALWQLASHVQNNALTVISGSGTVYEIPVVVHIIHTGLAIGTTLNPADSTIVKWINYLNNVFAAQHSLFPDTNSGGVRVPIKFVLAKRSPNCTATTGINRVNGTVLANYSANGVGTGGATDSAVKALSIWPSTDYYNIWLVNYIDGPSGTKGGYAYFPGAPSYLDGAIIKTIYSVPLSGGDYYYAVPHELGHAFGLPHTFEGDNNGASCPVDTNCLIDGDGVCDTEPHKNLGNGVCASGMNSCTGAAYTTTKNNIMNYTACPNRFTPGQRTKMLFNLMTNRAGLITSMGSVAPPSSTPALPKAACIVDSVKSPTNNADIGPRKVQLADLLSYSAGYTNDGRKAYIDHNLNCVQPSTANLTVGGTYTISVTTGPYNAENAKAWIDYNNSGTFESGEMILNATGSSAGQTFSNTFTLPSTATSCTALRLRVISDFSGSLAPQPCATLVYGQTEDFTVFVRPVDTPATTITISSNPSTSSICPGTNVNFSSTVNNAGISPTYQWQKNTVDIGSANASTYSTSSLADGEVIRCIFTSSKTCGTSTPVNSNTISFTVNSIPAPATISIGNTPSTTICAGTTVDFTSTVNDSGTSSSYQWRKNGANIGSANAPTFNSSNLADGDSISCLFTSTKLCLVNNTVSSNWVKFKVNPLPVPVIIRDGFRLSTTIPYPVYQWKRFGIVLPNSGDSAITAGANGEYTVSVSDINGCVGTSTLVNITNVGMSAISGQEYGLSVYPNPASNLLTVSWAAQAVVRELILSDMSGKQLQVIPVKGNSSEISVSGLAKGIYLLKAGEQIIRFTKQ